jgi:pullulanase
VATVEVAPPSGHVGARIFAGLKREGRVVARGESTVPARGTVEVALRAIQPATSLPDGEYELWLTLDRDGLLSIHPSFGDLYVRRKWNFQQTANRLRLPEPSAWSEKRLSRPANLITIHYRRYDEDYDDVGIWTWDAYQKRTPEQNEIFEVGRDDYGLVFQLDRGEYGEKGDTDKIGLLPRLGASWERKDGDDKFWRAAMGNEIYLVGTKNKIWPTRPDTEPHVAAAYIDAPDRLVLQVSRLVSESEITPDQITVEDDRGRRVAAGAARTVLSPGRSRSNYIELTTAEPLDIGRRSYTVRVQGFKGSVPATPRGVLDDAELFYDADAVLGADYSAERTVFRVFAPTAREAQVVVYDEPLGENGRNTYPMHAAGKGIWQASVPADLEGKYYLYSLDGEDLSPDREALDISCVNAVNSSQRARITDLSKTDPPGWQTGKVGPRVESPVDMVIYEMHVRDFTIAPNSPARPEHRGKYLGFIEAADHLVELGVTHVQLMPVQDFENDESGSGYSWGYATTAFNSPEGWFASDINTDSRVREFKQLVQALHQRGIGVILDVVYNHTAASAPFNFLVPRYYYRFWPDGSSSNGSGCGNDFRSESPMGRKFIIDSLKYWVQEYGVDGYRFDLMALLDLETMKQADRELRALRPDIVLYGEPWAAGNTAMNGRPTNKQTIRGTKIGAFNNEIRDALVGSPFDRTHAGFVQDGSQRDQVQRGVEGSWRSWGDGPHQVINYMSCHDNYVVYDKLKLSKPGATEQDLIDMMKLGYLILFTAQGVPFIHGGEEFARTKHGNDNSYNAPDEINQVDWSLKKRNHELFAYTRDLIALRRARPVFRLRAKQQIAAWLKFHPTPDPNVMMYTLDGSQLDGETWKQVCVVVNAADSMSTEVALPEGSWQVAFDHGGAVTEERIIEDTVRVRYKSGMILYQP